MVAATSAWKTGVCRSDLVGWWLQTGVIHRVRWVIYQTGLLLYELIMKILIYFVVTMEMLMLMLVQTVVIHQVEKLEMTVMMHQIGVIH